MKPGKQIRFPVFASGIGQYAIVMLVIAFIVLLCRPLANQQGYHIVSFVLLFVVSILAAFLGIPGSDQLSDLRLIIMMDF